MNMSNTFSQQRPWARGVALAAILAGSSAGCSRAEEPAQAKPAAAAKPAAVGLGAGAAAPAPAAVPAVAEGQRSSAMASTNGLAAAPVQPTNGVAAAAAPSLVDLRRQFYAFDQKFRAEDEVCVKLAAEMALMRQTIVSNEAVIQARLQATPEWNRLRNDLVAVQRAEDQQRMQLAVGRRGLSITNAIRRNVRQFRPGSAVTDPGKPRED